MAGAAIALVPQAPLLLASQVVVGTLDIAAVGARVALALQPPPGWTVADVPLQLQGLERVGDGGELRPVLAATAAAVDAAGGPAAEGQAQAQLQPLALVRNFYSPAGDKEAGADRTPQVSVLVLNAVLPEGTQAELAAAVLDLLERHAPPPAVATPAGQGAAAALAAGAEGACVYLAAALLLSHITRPADVYLHALNGAAPPPKAHPLPALPTAASARVRDGQLAALLHVLGAAGTRTCCVLAPGHKPPASTPPHLPDSAPACDALGGALAALLGLQYDGRRCRTACASHKWFVSERAAGSDVMYT